MNSPERLQGAERTVEQQQAAAERSAELAKSRLEQAGALLEAGRDSEAHAARKSAEAVFAAEAGKERRQGGEPSASPAAIRKITKKEKAKAYKQTLARVQSEMSAPARTFSKILHSPAVEKTSEIIGSTAARPNALLSGSVAAFLIVSAVYVIGRTYGYQLSGFEMIAAYGFGWAVGLIIDYVKIMATGKAA